MMKSKNNFEHLDKEIHKSNNKLIANNWKRLKDLF